MENRDLKADLKRITDWQEANITESIRWWSELIYWDAKGRDLTIDAEVAEEAIERAILAESIMDAQEKQIQGLRAELTKTRRALWWACRNIYAKEPEYYLDQAEKEG